MQRTLHTWGYRQIVFLLLLTLVLLPATAARAQGDIASPTSTPASMMADHLLRLADNILHEKQQPGSSQIIRGGLLVDMAIQANPNDPDARLMRKMMAQLAGDSDAAGEALAKYCQLRPEDDAAGFQLILAGLRAIQSTDQKAAAVEQLLNSAAQGTLSDALQSRMA
ncbi:MAG: hypothetical protein JKX85_00595, partial [Phycisphaeraceae bacterium]|nr:hypothetical protein [Phycisphaeraceae bacterium]